MGNNISAVDIVKQIYQRARSVSMTMESEYDESNWVSRAVRCQHITQKVSVKRFEPIQKMISATSGSQPQSCVLVEFQDGTKQEYTKIILATGYHTYFPFLDSSLFRKNTTEEAHSNKPRLHNLYLHTFHNKDPTLAVMGLILPGVLFHLMETQAIAIAGVLSNTRIMQGSITHKGNKMAYSTSLPNMQERERWENDRAHLSGSKFEFYESDLVQDELGKFLSSFGPEKRKSPLEVDSDAPGEYIRGLRRLELLFKKELGDVKDSFGLGE